MNITMDYFKSEVCQFRKFMGDKSFWAKTPEQRQKAIDGLSFVYLNIANPDGSNCTQEEINKAAILLDSTLTEYTRRETIMKLLP